MKSSRSLIALVAATAVACATEPPTAASVQITPDKSELYVGETQHFTAKVFDSGQTELLDRQVTWRIDSDRVASITPQGSVTAKDLGTATVAVSVDAVTSSIPLTVVGPLQVSLVGAGMVRGTWVEPTKLQCAYAIQARAVGGKAAAYGMWRAGNLVWTRLSDGRVNQEALGTNEVLEWWKADRIRASEVQAANRIASWTGPFTLLHSFEYQNETGQTRQAQVMLSCQAP